MWRTVGNKSTQPSAGIRPLLRDIRPTLSRHAILVNLQPTPMSLLRTFLLTSVVGLSIFSPASAHRPASPARSEKAIAAIRSVLESQRDAWNRGDIEGYMDGYDRSEKTVFVSGDTVTRGWQTVLERYRKNYDTREKMGVLTFSDLEITLFSNDSASVLGRWSLKRMNDEPHGRFTLIFKRTRKGWRIIHDHTS